MENKFLEQIMKTTEEINDLLAKSGYKMSKADEDQMEKPMDQEMAPDEMQQEPEMPEEDNSEEMMQEGEEDDEQGLAEQAKQLSNEELDMMIEILMAEKQNRGAEMQQEPEMSEPAEKAYNMKKEMGVMAKSMESLVNSVESLAKEVSSLKKTEIKKAVSKPAATNSVQVLEKSTSSKKEPARLSKSESVDFLLSELRKGNTIVNRDVIADFNLAKSDEDLHNLQKSMEKLGLTFPKV